MLQRPKSHDHLGDLGRSAGSRRGRMDLVGQGAWQGIRAGLGRQRTWLRREGWAGPGVVGRHGGGHRLHRPRRRTYRSPGSWSMCHWRIWTGPSTTSCRRSWQSQRCLAAGSGYGSPDSLSAATCWTEWPSVSTRDASRPWNGSSRRNLCSHRRSPRWPGKWPTDTPAPWRTCSGWPSHRGTRERKRLDGRVLRTLRATRMRPVRRSRRGRGVGRRPGMPRVGRVPARTACLGLNRPGGA